MKKDQCKCGEEKPVSEDTCYACYKKTWAHKVKPKPAKLTVIPEAVCVACE